LGQNGQFCLRRTAVAFRGAKPDSPAGERWTTGRKGLRLPGCQPAFFYK
jgi:hypothetical protein